MKNTFHFFMNLIQITIGIIMIFYSLDESSSIDYLIKILGISIFTSGFSSFLIKDEKQ